MKSKGILQRAFQEESFGKKQELVVTIEEE